MGAKHQKVQEDPWLGLKNGHTKDQCELPTIRSEWTHFPVRECPGVSFWWRSTDCNFKLLATSPTRKRAKYVISQYCGRDPVPRRQARERYDNAGHFLDHGKGRRYSPEEAWYFGTARWAWVIFSLVERGRTMGRTTQRALSSSLPLRWVQKRCHRSKTCHTLQKSLRVPYGGSCSIQRNTQRHCQKHHHWAR